MTELPESLGSLTTLRTLVASRNQLESLPASFTQLTKLLHFRCNQNRLSTLPDLRHFTQLRSLNVWGNRISELPDGMLANMQQLTLLDLSYNKLSIMPSELEEGSLKELMQLRIEGNPIVWSDDLQDPVQTSSVSLGREGGIHAVDDDTGQPPPHRGSEGREEEEEGGKGEPDVPVFNS